MNNNGILTVMLESASPLRFIFVCDKRVLKYWFYLFWYFSQSWSYTV